MDSVGLGRASGVGVRARQPHNGLELSLTVGSHLLQLLSLSQGGEKRSGIHCQEGLPPGFPTSFFTAVLEAHRRPLKRWSLAHSPPHPPPATPTVPNASSALSSVFFPSREMVVVMKFFRWVRRAWQRIISWVFFWRQKIKPTISGHPDSKKHSLKKMEKTLQVVETLRLVELPKEAKPKLGESPELADPCVLAKTTEETEVELGQQGQSLLQLPRTAVKSVSTLMVSALQSGWQMCSWKSSVSSASVSSQVRTQSPLKTPEAELLWEVYLVLWAIRKHLRRLYRRQERHRRHHVRCHAAPRPNPAQSLKLDAQSPL
ncbi:sperm acrosome developmental regulator isoform X1 [Pan paniscus]|nr:sperm acrosome developmental regulator isoform X1 [Pan troglodytes]XP_034820487.1 sperm acrosome developmental regulator isoform X1 [Pan paniscus]